MALGDFGVSVSPNTVAGLLHRMGYSLRVNHKKLSTDFSPDRNDQFLYLSDLRQRFQRRGLPIISVDTKKRELVGNFKNPGSRWDPSPRLVNDHDFRSDSTGVAIPYGIRARRSSRGSRAAICDNSPQRQPHHCQRPTRHHVARIAVAQIHA